MSPAPEDTDSSEAGSSAEVPWRPSASFEVVRRRAALYASLRRFFDRRGVLEVETPQLSAATVTDLHLHSLSCEADLPGGHRTLYLQTSPEFAMKRLLAAGSGPIFQLARTFRDAESGPHHNPEFTMLEWYRPGFDHHRLMDEMDALLGEVLGTEPAERRTYGELFEEHAGLDPHRSNVQDLHKQAREARLEVEGMDDAGRDDWLHLLWSHAVEPHLGQPTATGRRPTFVLDFPASQAALARIRPGDPPVAERFEVYIEGVELANGFHELDDAAEQRRRFEHDLDLRRAAGLPTPPIDEHLLAALAHGLGDCAGVALGVDRLLMLQVGARHISEVLTFPVDRA